MFNELKYFRLKCLVFLSLFYCIHCTEQIYDLNTDRPVVEFNSFNVTITIYPCASNPCFNGACEVLSFGYFCSCFVNYEGANCERLSNLYCHSNPCQNDGICTSTFGYEPYTCTCSSLFTGTYCETLADLDGLKQIKLNKTNVLYALNQTLEYLKLSDDNTTDLLTSNASNSLSVVSNFLNNVTKINLQQDSLTDDTNSTKKIEADLYVQIVDECINQANIYKTEKVLNYTQKLSKSFEQYVSNIRIPDSDFYSISTNNLAVVSYTINNISDISHGFVQSDQNDWNISLVQDVSDIDFNSIKVSAFFNKEILIKLLENGSTPTVSFTVYQNSILFDLNSSSLQDTSSNCSNLPGNQIISNVVSVSSDKKLFNSNSNIIKTLFKTLPSVNRCESFLKPFKYKCVFWDYSRSVWSSDGCVYAITIENIHVCECNHLTNFAILMSFDDAEIECQICKSILKYSTYMGNGLSILGLLITLIVYTKDIMKKKTKNKPKSIGFRSMFDYYVEILVSLSLSLLIMNILYLIFSNLTWDLNLIQCMISGTLLHYFLLSSFVWMLCFAILQYLTFNKVLFVFTNYYAKAALFSLGFPLIPIGAVLSVNWRLYLHPGYYCWLSGYPAVYGLVLPIMIVLLINLIVFFLIFRRNCNMCIKNEDLLVKNKELNLSRQTIILSTCFFNLGLTWITGFLLIMPMNEYLKTIFAFLFCVFNSLQGFFIFTTYILLSKSRRNYYKYIASEKFKKMKEIFTFEELNKTPDGASKKTNQTTFNESCVTETYSLDERL